jgi:hypothetical protein
MPIRTWLLVSLACLGACQPLTGSQVQDTEIIRQRIVGACLLTPLFKPVDTALTAAIPAATIPVDLKNLGVDIVCKNPAFFAAQNATTADWVMAQLKPYFRD